MKKATIFDLVTLILAVIFGLLAYTFQGLYFLTGLFIAISIISTVSFAAGLVYTFVYLIIDNMAINN